MEEPSVDQTLSGLVLNDVLTNSGECATVVRKVEPLVHFLTERHGGNKTVQCVNDASLMCEHYT